MTRLLYGGCTTFQPLPRKFLLVNLGVKKVVNIIWVIESKTPKKNKMSDCTIRRCPSVSIAAMARHRS